MSQSLTHAVRFPPCRILRSRSLPASDFVQRRRGKQRGNASRLGRPPFAVPQSRSQLLRNPWLLNRGCRRPSFVARCSRNWGCAEIENRSRHTKPETGLRRLEYVACRNCNIAKPHFGEIAHRRGCSSSAFFALNVVLRFFTEASKPHFALAARAHVCAQCVPNINIRKSFCESVSNINIRNSFGKSRAHVCAQCVPNINIRKSFCESVSNINIRNSFGKSLVTSFSPVRTSRESQLARLANRGQFAGSACVWF